ncbi:MULTISPECIES: DEAD/DEAH box helicase [Paenibacillus]|uniref:ATP-dependent helicase n=1 Tax=Paenibacillus albilobatus TaxID=2716884 RepID=A0A919XKT8_9BACL|nr:MULTISPECIES: DEAD/DEAH box helicase [Paenibacillus]GIO32300.1 ATP-dependent helicase [Paenibacillus albilobatus]
MNQPLYGVWLGDVFFCFSGEMSEPRVDAWSKVVKSLQLSDGAKPFKQAVLRLAELRYPSPSASQRTARRGERRQLMGRTLEGLALTPADAFHMLLGWDESACARLGLQPGAEMGYWVKAARFALELMLRGQIAPGTAEVSAGGSRRRAGVLALTGTWKPKLSDPDDVERFRQLAGAMPPVGLGVPALLGSEPLTKHEAGAAVLHSFLSAMIHASVQEVVRTEEGKLSRHQADYRRGTSPLAELWWNSLLTASRTISVQGTTEEVTALGEEVAAVGCTSIPEGPQDEERSRHGRLQLGFRLTPNHTEEQERWKVTFWAEFQDEFGAWLPVAAIWGYRERHIHRRGKIYENVQEQMLNLLGEAAALSPELAQALCEPAPQGMELSSEEMVAFVRHSVPRLNEAGMTVQMPSKWSRKGRRRVGLTLKMQSDDTKPGLPVIGMEQLVSFRVEAALDGLTLSREELAELSEAALPYVKFRGEWIELDLKEIRQVLRYLKKHDEGEMDLSEWLHLSAEEGGERLWKGIPVLGLETTGYLESLLGEDGPRKVPARPVPASLHGVLRPYQERGFQWLSAMRDMGFGVCLADDMGLGKTIQVITCLLEQHRKDMNPVLIICPTSLLGNWQRELQRFAPDLNLYIHHGNRRLHGEPFLEEAAKHDLVLTTYHLAGRDGADLAAMAWASVVLDEAQYIKNHRTKQAQSVMKLSAPHRIAMTGTPVENRLGELWSIFHFLNPGYLGSASSFRQRYTASEAGAAKLQELHKLVAPFMLRRLKSDPDIRKDLPEKLEIKSYCALTPVQGVMYRAVVEQVMERIGEETGIARKGLVLSSLTKLKQICDSPQLLGKEEKGAKGESSGKMERLLELLDQIQESGEAALIFTQYVEMGHLIVSRLEQRYGVKPSFLHGGVSKQERDQMVEAFQNGKGSPFFVLSLKAGGVGLNLTRANHVLHYDRWWNPAVENQATDRVFRIGQQKNVQVHKLICQGTLEERIDELIEHKKALSEQVVGSGETWLTEMSDSELRELITLQGEDWM